MFKDYDKKINKILSDKVETNTDMTQKRHKLMILRIQHERSIHLLVTIFVGVVMAMSFLATIISDELLLLFLDIPLLILFVAYLFHYRFLENLTQKWYLLEDILTNEKK